MQIMQFKALETRIHFFQMLLKFKTIKTITSVSEMNTIICLS